MPFSRYFRFRLRTLLALVLVISSAVGLSRYAAFAARFDLIKPGASPGRVRLILGEPDKIAERDPMGLNGRVYFPPDVRHWVYYKYNRGDYVIYTIEFAPDDEHNQRDWPVAQTDAYNLSEMVRRRKK